MKIVLYTEFLEPITVIDINVVWIKKLTYNLARCYGGSVVFRVPLRESLTLDIRDIPLTSPAFRTVDMRVELMRRRNVSAPIFMVDERCLVDALKLEPAPLPGQLRTMNERYNEGFIAGILTAIQAMRSQP